MALSDHANELYDRQIRLWGAETQAKLGKAEVLIVGLDQVAMDLAKNLVLSGCQLVLLDQRRVELEDIRTVFMYRSEDEGCEVCSNQKGAVAVREIAAMNSLTRVRCGTDLEADIRQSDCVCACNPSLEEISAIQRICEACGKGFYVMWSMGVRAACMVWLGRYAYDTKGKEQRTVSVEYPEVGKVIAKLPFEIPVSPVYEPCVSAVLAGVVSQDVLKVVTRHGEPIYNLFLYDCQSGNGVIRLLA